MDNSNAKPVAERYEACRVIDEECSRAMAAWVKMTDAVSAIDERSEPHAVHDELQL